MNDFLFNIITGAGGNLLSKGMEVLVGKLIGTLKNCFKDQFSPGEYIIYNKAVFDDQPLLADEKTTLKQAIERLQNNDATIKALIEEISLLANQTSANINNQGATIGQQNIITSSSATVLINHSTEKKK